jgi:hypothetical protein
MKPMAARFRVSRGECPITEAQHYVDMPVNNADNEG